MATFSQLFVTNNAGDDMVIQNPITGALTWHQTPGLEWRGFGKVTSYRKRDQFWFSNQADQGSPADQSIKIRFNDGAHAQVSGSISWEMPEDTVHLNDLHAKYGSPGRSIQQLPDGDREVDLCGPLR